MRCRVLCAGVCSVSAVRGAHIRTKNPYVQYCGARVCVCVCVCVCLVLSDNKPVYCYCQYCIRGTHNHDVKLTQGHTHLPNLSPSSPSLSSRTSRYVEQQMMSTRRAADDEADPRRGLACGDLGSALAVGAHGLEKDVEEAERYDETFHYTVLQYLQYYSTYSTYSLS